MKILLIALLAAMAGCATLTEDAMTPPVAFSFSDGSSGECKLENKRGAWPSPISATISIRKSDGSIPSEMGGKIIASAVFIDFGITDAITDKHRQYPAGFVIPIVKVKPAEVAVAVATPAPASDAAPTPAPTPTP
jgi:hypothetical protein